VRPDFPDVIDSSMRGAWATCPRKFYWQYIRNLRPKGGSVHLIAGGAFARGCEVTRKSYYDKNLSPDEALLAGATAALEAYGSFEPTATPKIPSNAHPKRLERVLEGLAWYFTRYPFHTDAIQPIKMPDGTHKVEFTFAIPLDIRHPVTGNPIIYAGRNDMLAQHSSGILLVHDDKTVSQLGPTWSSQWSLRAQLDGYVWAARQLDFPCEGANVRGLAFYKNDFGTAESLQLRTKWQLARWYDQTMRNIKAMIAAWQSGQWDYDLDSACSSYGGCAYQKLCSVENPDDWVEGDYEVSVWNPLEHKSTSE